MAEKFRHELKYIVSFGQVEILKCRLDAVMKKDIHTIDGQKYVIRSLYFDDADDRCFFENDDGVNQREKYRIRIYNGDMSRISLECKKKENGMTNKASCLISEAECRGLMSGQAALSVDPSRPVFNRLLIKASTALMRPKAIVEYDRIPYVCTDGRVRVTFDLNIRSSSAVASFLDQRIAFRPIMPCGLHVLEVKYDEFLPEYIKNVLQLDGVEQTKFSKYYLCRKYSI